MWICKIKMSKNSILVKTAERLRVQDKAVLQ